MNIKLNREAAAECLTILSPGARTPATPVIISTTDRGVVTFSLATSEQIVEIDCPAEIIAPGAIGTPIKYITQVISNAQCEEITIKMVLLNSGSLSIRLSGTGVNAAPAYLSPELGVSWKEPPVSVIIPQAATLRALIGRVRKALEEGSTTNANLDCVRLVITEGAITAFAASNYKLASARYEDSSIETTGEVFLPFSRVDTILRLLSSIEGPVILGLDSGAVSFAAKSMRFSCGAQAQGPPDISQMFGASGLAKASISATDLKHAIGVVSAGVDPQRGLVAIRFAEGMLRLRADESQAIAYDVPAVYQDRDKDVRLNFRLEALSATIGRARDLDIYFADGRPTVWVHAGDELSTRFVLAQIRS